MKRRTLLFVVVLALSVGFGACKPLEPELAQHGPLPSEQAKFDDAVPLEYGDLVGVTPHPENPHWAALWFEGQDQTIAVVWVNVVAGQIDDGVCLIPRR